MTPHPQSRASLLALNDQLKREAFDRNGVYDRMANKIWTDWKIRRVLFTTRCFSECMPEHFAARSKIDAKVLYFQSGIPIVNAMSKVDSQTDATKGNATANPVKTQDLRVWWIPQVPMKPFYVLVKTVSEAHLILNALAEYDTFQFENNIKPDFCNAGGLEEEEGGGWFDWEDDDGNDIDHTEGGRLFQAV